MNSNDRFDEGSLAIEVGQLDKAEAIFQELINENPENYLAINKLGVVYANKKQFELAEEQFQRAFLLQGDYGPAIVNIGNVYREYGDASNAEKQYKLAIERDPEYYLSYYNLAALRKSKGDIENYMKYMKQYRRAHKKYISDTNFKERTRARTAKEKKYNKIIIIGTFLVILIMYIIKSL